MSSGISASLVMQPTTRLDMTLTPQIIQSMELLQMPLLQLEQRLRQEQLDNPVLELSELEERPDADNPSAAEEDANGATYASSLAEASPEGGKGEAAANQGDNDTPREKTEADDGTILPDWDQPRGLERADDLDYSWNDIYDNLSPSRRRGDANDEDVFDPIANATARPPSLVEHLLEQLGETSLPPRLRQLASWMAQKIDANGWLTVPLSEVLPYREEATPEELSAALKELQKLDPDGVGARNLSECLLLQLANRPEATVVTTELARHHLEDLAANRLPKIAKNLQCSLDEVKTAAALIRTLNPRPGAGFSASPPPPVRPDLIIEEAGDGTFLIRLVSGANPQVSEFWIALYDNSRRGKILRQRLENDPVRGPAFKEFQEHLKTTGMGRLFREKYNNAQFLVKAVAQRERTLLSVAEEIVRVQKDYLARLSPAPAPLFMQDIALRIGYDISTISRAVKDKYIDTPIGIKPMKDFFSRSSGVDNDGAANSNASVLLKIREMIETEDKRHPLRDNDILKSLAAEGITIKRRSIVNYREKMGYPSHSHRKEY
ncbi:MAG: RNA polymerase factor sigma-54 [Planctomycetota bacterium]|nr:RNA polymerase factor sigma-54 [Planctomycetota bacterium]